MEVVISFLVTVLAGVACHYIIKWLDSEKKNPRIVLQHNSGIRSLSTWTCDFFLPIGIIAYDNFCYKIHFFQKNQNTQFV